MAYLHYPLTARTHSTDALTPPFTQQTVLPANRFRIQPGLQVRELEFLQLTPLANSARCVELHTEPLLPTANSPHDCGGVDKHGASSETATGITTLLELAEELVDELVLQRKQLLGL
jgi:hypothetical protein